MAKDLRYLGSQAYFRDLARLVDHLEYLPAVPDIIADKLLLRRDFIPDSDYGNKPESAKDGKVDETDKPDETDKKIDEPEIKVIPDVKPVFTDKPTVPK